LDAALSAPELSELQLLEQHWGVLGDIARGLIANEVSWLRNASSLADIFAKVFIDKGGRPKMVPFRVLAKGLATAFEVGTGRRAKVSWSEADSCWGGKFLKLVAAVLPLVEALAGATERPLAAPRSPVALGQYLHDLTRANTRNKNRPRSSRKP